MKLHAAESGRQDALAKMANAAERYIQGLHRRPTAAMGN